MDELDQKVAALAEHHAPSRETADNIKRLVMIETMPDAYKMVADIFRNAFAVFEQFSGCNAMQCTQTHFDSIKTSFIVRN